MPARWLRSRQIGFVFQLPALLARASALENVELPLGYAGVSGAERHRRARTRSIVLGLSHRVGSLAASTVGRRAAARRHRPRDRQQSGADFGRRADRRARQQDQRGDLVAVQGFESGRTDDRRGHARHGRRRMRAAPHHDSRRADRPAMMAPATCRLRLPDSRKAMTVNFSKACAFAWRALRVQQDAKHADGAWASLLASPRWSAWFPSALGAQAQVSEKIRTLGSQSLAD